MTNANALILLVGSVVLAGADSTGKSEENLLAKSPTPKIVLVVPAEPDPLEQYAASELASHVKEVTGAEAEISKTPGKSGEKLPPGVNLIVLGRLVSNPVLRDLAERDFFKANEKEQGYSLRIASGGKTWLAVLCGADPLGTLYAVRDFCHYHFYRDTAGVVLRPARVSLAPVIKIRQLSESGCNLFSADNDHEQFMYAPRFNYFSRNVVFDKKYFVDWLSEWKVSHVAILWCNYGPYEKAVNEFIEYAHSRGVKVAGFIVPFRPMHEAPPPEVSKVVPPAEGGDCPHDPAVRKWYFDRLAYLVSKEPRFDAFAIESPYHDGVYCGCPKCKGRKNPYPEDKMLEEMTRIVRRHRPDMPIIRGMKQPIGDEATGKRLAEQLKKLEGPLDWYMNTYIDREHRRRWHDLGPKFATYLRVYRSALRSKDFPAEIDFLFNDFRMSAQRGVLAHGFCHRFYAGRLGSYRIENDDEMMKKYPGRLGRFSLALTAEAAFDPFVEGEARARKVRRIHELTIPDYPLGRKLTAADFKAVALQPKERQESAAPVIEDPAARPAPSKLFSDQYGIKEPGFLIAQVCADLDNDGKREIFYSSRGTKRSHLLRAADGTALWSKRFEGEHQSICAYDLDGDGKYEILYSVSGPGRLYMLDCSGKILKQWDVDDWKLGNSAVIIDGDGDGVLDGYFGTRGKYLVRLNMKELTLIRNRTPWVQCGSHTSAMDVDGDGKWDLFAGNGDDSRAKGTLHRYDPVTLQDVWSYSTDDNASSADPVLADIDGDGRVEIVKSVDNYANDDAHDAVYALKTDGTVLWKVDGFSGEDSPNVADLDGDGAVEIVGMTFGGVVYCLDGRGRVKWQKDLRPELDDSAHAYMTPILCDLNGDKTLEILAVTNGGYEPKEAANGVLFALGASGRILDRFDLGSPRFWGTAFYVNVDDDPYMELVVSGGGGLDVIQTKGFGPNTEHFQRRRSYQRLNVVPWAYEDSYFIYRGKKEGVRNLTDNLVLERTGGRYRSRGTFTTELLTLPPGCFFDRIDYESQVPDGTTLRLNVLNQKGEPILEDVRSGRQLHVEQPLRLQFVFSTSDGSATPELDYYRLSFDR